MMRLIFSLFLYFAFLSNSNSAASSLSVDAFSRLPDVSTVSLSPNGNEIVSLVRYEQDGISGILLGHLDLTTNQQKALLTTDNSKYLISWVDWAGSNESVLLGVRYPAKIYNTPITVTRLLRVDIETLEVTSAVPRSIERKADYRPIVQDNVIDFMRNSADEVLIALRTSNSVESEVYKINHKKSSSKRVHRSRGWTMNWTTDQQNNLRIAWYFKDTTMRIDYRDIDTRTWSTLFEFETFDGTHKYPLGFDSDSNILYYLALHEGRNAVFKADVSKRPLQPVLVYADKTYDVEGSLVYSEKNSRVVGIRYSVGDGYVFWDDEYKGLQESLNLALPNTNNRIVNFSRDERRAVIFASSDINPGNYLLWDRDQKTADHLAYRYKNLTPKQMSKKVYISYKARDGLTISGYLTQPKDAKKGPGATIIFPHGGPISYDGQGFDYWTQYFASRGYNVLQMNFRGSSGYGHDFMAAGLKDWGGKMQTDVEDGTRWLIKEGIADPKRICVVGASYGGYAALMEAANNPDLYQCAVSFAGVTDLKYLVAHARKYVNKEVVKEMIGSNSSDLKRRSPLSRAKETNIPLLIVQGTKDRRVPVAHGRRMNKHLEKAGKDVTYIELKDGDHYLSNEEHRVAFFRHMDTFLRKHLD